MKIQFILLLLLFSGELVAAADYRNSFIPRPLQPIDDASNIYSSTYRAPAALEDNGQNIDPELLPLLNHRIYYYDPKSGATCLGIEGENECLNP